MYNESSLEVAHSHSPQFDGADGDKQAYFDPPYQHPTHQQWDTKALAQAQAKSLQESSDSKRHKSWQERHPLLLAGIVALITAIVVGAAIGGGVGSAMKASSSSCTSQAAGSTTNSTNSNSTAAANLSPDGLQLDYAVKSPRDIETVALDCPAIDKQTYTTSTGPTFAISCTVGLFQGDVGCTTAYTLYDCIEACANMNYMQGVRKACTKVEYHATLANATGPPAYGNCWLKNGTAVTVADEPGSMERLGLAASAQIVSS